MRYYTHTSSAGGVYISSHILVILTKKFSAPQSALSFLSDSSAFARLMVQLKTKPELCSPHLDVGKTLRKEMGIFDDQVGSPDLVPSAFGVLGENPQIHYAKVKMEEKFIAKLETKKAYNLRRPPNKKMCPCSKDFM